MDAIFQTTFSHAFSWMKMWKIRIKNALKFVPKSPINNIPALPLFEPMMVNLLMHICVTRPQWVNLSLSMMVSYVVFAQHLFTPVLYFTWNFTKWCFWLIFHSVYHLRKCWMQYDRVLLFLLFTYSNCPTSRHICNNDVIITSKWCHFDVITSKWHCFDVITTLLLYHVFGGHITRTRC